MLETSATANIFSLQSSSEYLHRCEMKHVVVTDNTHQMRGSLQEPYHVDVAVSKSSRRADLCRFFLQYFDAVGWVF